MYLDVTALPRVAKWMVEEKFELPKDFRTSLHRAEVTTLMSTVGNDDGEEYKQPAQDVLDGENYLEDLMRKNQRPERERVTLPIPEKKHLTKPILFEDLPKTNLSQAMVMNHLQYHVDK